MKGSRVWSLKTCRRVSKLPEVLKKEKGVEGTTKHKKGPSSPRVVGFHK